jgi:hypothetical protein
MGISFAGGSLLAALMQFRVQILVVSSIANETRSLKAEL